MKVTKRMLCVMSMLILFFGLTFTQTESDVTSPTIGTLKYVPAGSFQRDERKDNISTVSAFYMSEKEITREQYTEVTGMFDHSDSKTFIGMNDPVQNVRWYHALVFCNKLSKLEGLTPVYSIKGSTDPAVWGAVPAVPSKECNAWDSVIADWSANGYRLPTEMEWMWAAMEADKDNPGKTNRTGYLKEFAGSNGSNNIGDYAWYSINNNASTYPVGTRQPNELGLYDMSGNVWEWCWDWYGAYPTGSNINYRGATTVDSRVVRGGSWYNGAFEASIAYRYYWAPFSQCYGIGFRVVRSK